jgi:hypothetical protein
MRGGRDSSAPGHNDRLVGETFAVHLDLPETPVKGAACENMIEHLAPAAMQHRPPAFCGQRPVQHEERLRRKAAVAGVGLTRHHQPQRGLMILGVEIADDSD